MNKRTKPSEADSSSSWMSTAFAAGSDTPAGMLNSHFYLYMIDTLSTVCTVSGFGFEKFLSSTAKTIELASRHGKGPQQIQKDLCSVLSLLPQSGPYEARIVQACASLGSAFVRSSVHFDEALASNKPTHWIVVGYRLHDASYACRLAYLGPHDGPLTGTDIGRKMAEIVRLDIASMESDPTSQTGRTLRFGGGPIIDHLKLQNLK